MKNLITCLVVCVLSGITFATANESDSSIATQVVQKAIASTIADRGSSVPVTTVITHGLQLGDQPPDWAYGMAYRITNRGGPGGFYVYDWSDGAWDLWFGDASIDGPITLVFDWAMDSSDDDYPFLSIAAADAFYAALRDPGGDLAGVELVEGRYVHLIGHSRGAVVNGEIARRLSLAGLEIDHVTALDAHPVDGTNNECWTFENDLGDPTPTIWVGMNWFDNYYRQDGSLVRGGGGDCDPDGILLYCNYECQLNESVMSTGGYFREHADTHLWYHGTVDTSTPACDGYAGDGECLDSKMRSTWYDVCGQDSWLDQGYYWSRIGGGASERPGSDLTKNTSLSVPILFNGTFDGSLGGDIVASIAGWDYHGGAILEAQLVEGSQNSYMELAVNVHGNNAASALAHNRFYMPEGVATLAFDYMCTTESSSSTEVQLAIYDAVTGDPKFDEVFQAQGDGVWHPGSFPLVGVPGDRAYRVAFSIWDLDEAITLNLDNVTIEVEPTGACCLPDACTYVSEEECLGSGGTYFGPGTGCGQDCNNNDIGDVCDIANGTAQDCNSNEVPDECDIADGSEEDCDGNEIPDSCDVADVFQQEAKLTASDGASSDYFGYSVSISSDGTTAIVGALWHDDNGSNSGSAYIYKLVDGIWQETKLLASDGAEFDSFGISVSISGDGTTAIVGAHLNDDNGTESGSAYVFRFDGTQWTQEAKLLASNGSSGDYFGYSVSISGDGTTTIVGAYLNDDNGSSSGSAYIYELAGGVWQETKLLASDGASGDEFGFSVSISSDGTTAIVGASHDDDNGTESGSAYIYSLVKGVWEETELLASDGAGNDHFGYSVSISSDGTTAIVGAHLNDDNGTESGSAYIYSLVKGIWQETKLLASDGASGDRFGYSVSISSDGSTAIVGARDDDDNGTDSGSAYIYELVSGVWEETKLLASDGASGDNFGNSVSISSDGTTALVGARHDDDNGSNSGSAYVFSSIPLFEWDCNDNSLVDSCEIEDDPSLDCDQDGVIDTCAIASGLAEDCNLNAVPDACDIADGTSSDVNGDGVPDECQCLADVNEDGEVNVNDLITLIAVWNTASPTGDINFDGYVDIEDLLLLIVAWGPCE